MVDGEGDLLIIVNSIFITAFTFQKPEAKKRGSWLVFAFHRFVACILSELICLLFLLVSLNHP